MTGVDTHNCLMALSSYLGVDSILGTSMRDQRHVHVSAHLAHDNLLESVRQLRLPDADSTTFAVHRRGLASAVVMGMPDIFVIVTDIVVATLRLLDAIAVIMLKFNAVAVEVI